MYRMCSVMSQDGDTMYCFWSASNIFGSMQRRKSMTRPTEQNQWHIFFDRKQQKCMNCSKSKKWYEFCCCRSFATVVFAFLFEFIWTTFWSITTLIWIKSRRVSNFLYILSNFYSFFGIQKFSQMNSLSFVKNFWEFMNLFRFHDGFPFMRNCILTFIIEL